jgi:hypothetical protein
LVHRRRSRNALLWVIAMCGYGLVTIGPFALFAILFRGARTAAP